MTIFDRGSFSRIATLLGIVGSLFLPTDPVLMGQEEPRSNSGLVKGSEHAFEGYVLVAPIMSRESFLLSAEGEIVHRWESDGPAGLTAYLLDDGSLLRARRMQPADRFKRAGGGGGMIERFTWEGEKVWSYQINDDLRLSHHDMEPLPNGNVLVVAWEYKDAFEATNHGRIPLDEIQPMGVWSDTIYEIKPEGRDGGEVVWKWSAWDHTVQDVDESLSTFGEPAEHPHRIDLNYFTKRSEDWTHLNSIDYHPELDQILLSARFFHEIWIIDHSTTTEEAASSKGGKGGRGGDLLYRWGNPAAYGKGRLTDEKLFGQHDARWVEPGVPGAGNITVFNNGTDRSQTPYSTVLEIEPPLQEDGSYALEEDGTWGPERYVWRFGTNAEDRFFSSRISGTQKLPT
ncbi:MAG: aryl-sulfate sulfotransferase, partial [Verrucomicrobiota bacterium]